MSNVTVNVIEQEAAVSVNEDIVTVTVTSAPEAVVVPATVGPQGPPGEVGSGLAEVTHDETLEGKGTVAEPLSVLSGGMTFGFVAIDPSGNGDYTTVELAIAAGERSLYLEPGTHDILDNMTIDATSDVPLKIRGAGIGVSTMRVPSTFADTMSNWCMLYGDTTNQSVGDVADAYTSSGKVLTRAAGSWVADGFEAGMYIYPGDNNQYGDGPIRIIKVEALALTVDKDLSNFASLVSGNCNEVIQFCQTVLHFEDITFNWDWDAYLAFAPDSVEAYSYAPTCHWERVEWQLGDNAGTGSIHPMEDIFGHPSVLRDVIFSSNSAHTGHLQPYYGLNTVFYGVYFSERHFFGDIAASSSIGCFVPNINSNATNSTVFIACQFGEAINGSVWDGALGDISTPVLIGCWDVVDGDWEQLNPIVWGTIGGLLAAQTDLSSAINAKLAHTTGTITAVNEAEKVSHSAISGGTISLFYVHGNTQAVTADGTAFTIGKGSWPTGVACSMLLYVRLSGTDGLPPTITWDAGWSFSNTPPPLDGMTADTGWALVELSLVDGDMFAHLVEEA